MLRARPLLALLACTLALAACGDGEPAAEVRTTPSASTATLTTAPPTGPSGATGAPAAPSPSPGTTGPSGGGGATPSNPGGASAEEANPGGAGDEEPIRQPAAFELGSVTLRPASVRVSPFLPVELEVRNVDEGVHRVKLIGTDVAFTVQGGQTETRRLPGLAKGTYTLSVDAGDQASVLVVGDEVGP